MQIAREKGKVKEPIHRKSYKCVGVLSPYHIDLIPISALMTLLVN